MDLTVSNGFFSKRLTGSSSSNVIVGAPDNVQTWTLIQTNSLLRDDLNLPVPFRTGQRQFLRACIVS